MAGDVLNVEDWSAFESDNAQLSDVVMKGNMARAMPGVVAQVRRQKSRIIANWALRVANMPAFRAMPDLRLEEVQRHIPEVLDSTLTAIASSDPTMDPEPLARASELASAHGQARLLDEFGVGDVLTEFHALRREVSAALWRVVEGEPGSVGLLRELDRRLSDTFDAITISAAEAWVGTPGTGRAA